ncbi:hypothetical protein [Streptomyces rapamycinicus]|uniref:Uncharacterized protein n=1 Tax=Streptomyces rapamycinicus TaxID=1226757 RepID=A0ABR6LN21_9ACTN|nr:hypothetical protein [Streptomyces rapamycinicus]MBB4783740.1 hypothetical protein [Streptomyces rapamycinicus]UTP37624.1 hypothetical protein LIV37_23510 [Streptomyces rapamycinicus NRRL 5491]
MSAANTLRSARLLVLLEISLGMMRIHSPHDDADAISKYPLMDQPSAPPGRHVLAATAGE